MKKILVFLFFTVITLLGVTAEDPQTGNSILLTQKIDNPIGGHGGLQKDETPSIFVEQIGHTLYFDEDYSGCLVTLIDGEDIVHSAYIPMTGIVNLPDSLSGTFDLVLYIGGDCFVGEITL